MRFVPLFFPFILFDLFDPTLHLPYLTLLSNQVGPGR